MGTKPELERRLAFLEWTESDRELLEGLKDILDEEADSLVSAFYRHLLSFDDTRTLLSDPQVTNRLFEMQKRYLLSLAGPKIDAAYVEERHRIGETHVDVGLEPRWYLGAYAIYFSMLAPLVMTRGDALRGERTLQALIKLLMLDAQLAMEAYIDKRQEQLEHLNRELAEMGRSLSRDYEVRTRELRKSQTRAQAAEQLASSATLMAGLAHEIGTPMGVIRGHAELLESSVDDDRSRWRAQAIREQVDRISNIIQTLLNIARPRDPVYVELDLKEVLETTLAFLAEQFRRRGIQVESELADTRTIRGDRDRLQQLFLNLFLNAVDAMPEGGQLTVLLKPNGEHLETCVTDTGVGIPSERLSHVFDPFFTTKPAGQGNGLGLVVAREIVEDHRGEMEIESEVGQGTKFCISLPCEPRL